MSYHATVQDVYRDAANTPDASLCCVPSTPRYLPGLSIPSIMHEMNYGCGTTIHLQDMAAGPDDPLRRRRRRPRGAPARLLRAAPRCGDRHRSGGGDARTSRSRNLERGGAATTTGSIPSFVDIRDGDALRSPGGRRLACIVAAQNCLFNIFRTARAGGRRAGRPRAGARARCTACCVSSGRLVMSDPIAHPADACAPARRRRPPRPVPLRDVCSSTTNTSQKIVEAGFGSASRCRSRRPYRMLDAPRVMTSTRTSCSRAMESLPRTRLPIPADGACVFTGRDGDLRRRARSRSTTATGHVLLRDLPLPVCDKTGRRARGELSDATTSW